jgi:hypothetical protein
MVQKASRALNLLGATVRKLIIGRDKMGPDDAKACRGRAEYIRVRAEVMPQTEARAFMLKLAEDYELLADAIESTAWRNSTVA